MRKQINSFEEYLQEIRKMDEAIILLEKQIKGMIKEVEELRIKIAGN